VVLFDCDPVSCIVEKPVIEVAVVVDMVVDTAVGIVAGITAEAFADIAADTLDFEWHLWPG